MKCQICLHVMPYWSYKLPIRDLHVCCLLQYLRTPLNGQHTVGMWSVLNTCLLRCPTKRPHPRKAGVIIFFEGSQGPWNGPNPTPPPGAPASALVNRHEGRCIATRTLTAHLARSSGNPFQILRILDTLYCCIE